MEGPLPADQVNLTDEESRIMPIAGGGFDQCYNAQAVVAADSLLVVATDVVQAPNDKQQLEPMLGKHCGTAGELGKVGTLLADNGYYSESNVNACAAAGIEPVIAMGREAHHPSLAERFAEDPAPPEDPTPVEAMALSPPDESGQEALRAAQANARAGVRHHQVGAWVPPVSAAWPRQCSRRVETRDHGVEHKADVRPGGSDLSKIAPVAARFAVFANDRPAFGMTFANYWLRVSDLPIRGTMNDSRRHRIAVSMR